MDATKIEGFVPGAIQMLDNTPIRNAAQAIAIKHHPATRY
jgi:hypothetical protein